MNTQTLLNNVATGTIKVLQERSQDMGINWNKVGEFSNFDELISLLVEAYPFEEIDWDDVYEFLDQEYIEMDDEDIDCVQIVDNAVYKHYRDIRVLDYCDCLIHDTKADDYLFGFSNTGWARIDGAIDLETGTVGYYNSIEDIYTPVGYLHDDDLDMLNGIIQDFDLSIDYECSVKRENKVAA